MGISDELTLDEVLSCLKEDARKQRMGGQTYSPVHMFAAIRFLEALAAANKRVKELEGIVSKLPKTADGVPVVPGMEVWVWGEGELEGVRVPQQVHPSASWLLGVEKFEGGGMLHYSKMYSTRSAAAAALEGGK